ncbi:MAG: formate dehydrogenase, partial [Planctomycetes bacterium]|nr:formate dehydrogenase [Planctomycetota bacterium]
MQIKRRTFLAGTSGTLLGLLGIDPRPTVARPDPAAINRGQLTTSVCPFCAVGCGVIVTASADKVLEVQGDPDHPINLGSLCAKGTAMVQVANNPRRLKKIKYHAAGSTEWEEKDWDWVIGRIALRIKQTRDSSFQTTDPEG